MRLVGTLVKFMSKFVVSFERFVLLLSCLQIFLQLLNFSLLRLESVGEEKRLLDPALGSSRSCCNGLDKSVSNGVGSVVVNGGLAAGKVHDGLV